MLIICMLNSVQLQIADKQTLLFLSHQSLFSMYSQFLNKKCFFLCEQQNYQYLSFYQQRRPMYNFQLAQKRGKEAQQQNMTQRKERKWLKRYKTEVKPKLLAHYDARLKAFIRQIEEEPQDPSRVLRSNITQHYPPFKFKLYQTYGLKNASTRKQQLFDTSRNCSVLRSSEYNPISQYQFRQRQKQKQIRPTVNIKNLIFRKKQKEQYLISIEHVKSRQTVRTNRISTGSDRKRSREDNRSQLHSSYDDNQSIRNSANQNIQKEACEYEKRQELTQKKKHYKKLANLQQKIQDPVTRKTIQGLLVKGGHKRIRIKTQNHSVQSDFFNMQTDKIVKL